MNTKCAGFMGTEDATAKFVRAKTTHALQVLTNKAMISWRANTKHGGFGQPTKKA